MELLKPNQSFVIIKHYEKFFLQNGQKKLTPYLFIQTNSGKRGYIRGKEVHLLATEHTRVLRNYYQNPPLLKNELKTSERFLKIVKRNKKEVIGTVGRGK